MAGRCKALYKFFDSKTTLYGVAWDVSAAGSKDMKQIMERLSTCCFVKKGRYFAQKIYLLLSRWSSWFTGRRTRKGTSTTRSSSRWCSPSRRTSWCSPRRRSWRRARTTREGQVEKSLPRLRLLPSLILALSFKFWLFVELTLYLNLLSRILFWQTFYTIMPCTAFYINIPDVQQTLLIIQHGVVLAGTAACLFGDCMMHWWVAFHTFDNFKWGLESFSYDKVSANGATSEPQCNKKSDVSQDARKGSTNSLN